jgi:hypothetical protein
MNGVYAPSIHTLLDWLTVFGYLAFAGFVAWRIIFTTPNKLK